METHADFIRRLVDFHQAVSLEEDIADAKALLRTAHQRQWDEFEGILYGMHRIRDMSYNNVLEEDIKAMYDGIDEWYSRNVWGKQ
jgi:hypothetical protein